ncbi:MAG: lysoplasmalogenase [Rhizobacter sp.]|nr:lysoplasmalogenase [Ferruginibacter sp.]
MKSIVKQYGFTAFLLVAITHLAAILFGIEEGRFITKLLLMPLLALAVYGSSAPGKGRTIILIAILFSFAGDGFLLFDYKNPLYFIAGLISFLITHILYIIYFLGLKPVQPSLLKKRPWIIIVVVVYGIGLVYFLFPKLGALQIPVMLYAFIICSMLSASIHIYSRVNHAAGTLFVTGALFFVISDSLLALDKFNAPFPYASFFIMLTYCAAQYFIARGFVKCDG